MAALLTICKIFSWKSPFSPTVFWLSTPIRGIPSNINVTYTLLKSIFSGLQFSCRQHRSIYIRLAVVVSQICEITRNSEKIPTYISSRSSKIIDLGANQKRTCNLLVVINSNFGRISYRFSRYWCTELENSLFSLENSLFSAPRPCLTLLLRQNPLEFLDETYPAKTRGIGLLYGENAVFKQSDGCIEIAWS